MLCFNLSAIKEERKKSLQSSPKYQNEPFSSNHAVVKPYDVDSKSLMYSNIHTKACI